MSYKVGDRVWLGGVKYIVGHAQDLLIPGDDFQRIVIYNRNESIRLYSDDDELKPIITMKSTLGKLI